MQKVEGSNPFSRFPGIPLPSGISSFWRSGSVALRSAGSALEIALLDVGVLGRFRYITAGPIACRDGATPQAGVLVGPGLGGLGVPVRPAVGGRGSAMPTG